MSSPRWRPRRDGGSVASSRSRKNSCRTRCRLGLGPGGEPSSTTRALAASSDSVQSAAKRRPEATGLGGLPARPRPPPAGDRRDASAGDADTKRLPTIQKRRRSSAERVIPTRDRKSTRLNSSHSQISYAVFCLKKKKKRLAPSVCTLPDSGDYA